MARISGGRHEIDSDLLCEECGCFPCECTNEDIQWYEERERASRAQEEGATYSD
jgi:hypothetical protein